MLSSGSYVLVWSTYKNPSADGHSAAVRARPFSPEELALGDEFGVDPTQDDIGHEYLQRLHLAPELLNSDRFRHG